MTIHEDCTGDSYRLAVGTITGQRSWRLTPSGKYLLPAQYYKHMYTSWRSGDNTALCDRTESSGVCDDAGCQCGFWAYHAKGRRGCGGHVQGVIEAWGKVTLGTKGFRAEHARVIAVCRRGKPHLNWKPVYQAASAPLILGAAAFALHDRGGVIVSLTLLLALFVLISMVWYSMAHVTKRQLAGLREAYPDVIVYKNHKEMLRNHPLTYTAGDVT